MKRWFIKWSDAKAPGGQKEYGVTYEDRVSAYIMLDYIETEDSLKLLEFREID